MISSRWQPIAMQGVLCGVLAVSIAAAALLIRQKHLALRVKLDEVRTFGRLRLGLPRGWVVTTGPGEVVHADEPAANGQSARRLTIACPHITGLVSPVEEAVHCGVLTGIDSEGALLAGVSRGQIQIEPVDVAGWPGRLIRRPHPSGGPTELVACALPTASTALVIKLESPGLLDAADNELIGQMTEPSSVQIVGLPPAGETGGVVDLPDGIVVEAPRHFYLLPGDDANIASRRLISDGASDAWTGVDLVPCVFCGDDGEAAVESMLIAYDRGWKGGPVKSPAPLLWQADATDDSDIPRRAYLMTDGQGQALLAVFHGGLGDGGSEIAAAWSAMAPTVRFTRRRDVNRLLSAGNAEARHLADLGLGGLIGRGGQQVWWLGDASDPARKVLWMRLDWTCSGQDANADWTGQRRTAWVETADPSDGTDQQWSSHGDLRLYSTVGSTVARQGGSGVDPLGTNTPRQRLSVDAGQLHRLLPTPGLPDVAVPGQYVPGGWLPLLLGQVSRDLGAGGTMILRSESFVGYDALPLRSWLLLVIGRDEESSAPADERGEPMECLTITVNGSGRLSRWYFSQGALRYIDLPGGRRAIPAGDAPRP